MAKLKNPLLSLGAVGRLAKDIVFARRRKVNIVEKKPIPKDAKSLLQLDWRHMYQKAVLLWHALSATEKQEWESLARPKHMTGFAWFMSQCLRPNPGIYLPLQGGIMSGDIDMAKHHLTNLPEPVDDQDAARKIDLAEGPPAADYPMKLKPALTRYVMPGWYATNVSPVPQAAGRIFYIPIFVSETTTYTAIVINIETAVAGTADLRIFAWANGVPGALILSAGTVNTGTTGAKEIVISRELTRGYYFLATRTSATPKFWGLSTTSPISPPVAGFRTNSWPYSDLVVLSVDAEYADPAPAPTNGRGAICATVFLKET